MANQTVVLRNGSDTIVAEQYPTRNYQSLATLSLRNSSPVSTIGYLFFARPFPLGSNIVSAKLRLFTAQAFGAGTHGLWVYRTASGWNVSKMNWNTAATGAARIDVLKTSNSVNDMWEIDVTTHMQSVANGTAWYGFRVQNPVTALHVFHSFDSAYTQYRPQLEIVWNENPDKPTTLTPSGGRKVSIAKPTLRFNFTDDAGNVSLAAVQVQINATNVWTSPSFDSGEVTTTVPELDLTTTAYAGLSDGATTYWRVRVKDGSGNWSPWSDGALFGRTNKGTVTITAPADPPNNFVYEYTPPVAWTFSGTQAQWRVAVDTSATAGSGKLHDTGWRTGTDNGYTLPSGVLSGNGTYVVTVLVRDNVARVVTPGDADYSADQQTFTFAYDATPNPFTGLTATSVDPYPWMQLDFSRSSSPDYVAIRRDGVVIATNLDPADLFVSGTAYRYVDKTASANISHTWTVEAVVNGKTAASSPTVTATMRNNGMWVVDLSRDLKLYVAADSGGMSWEMGEDATTFAPVGGHATVRIVQSTRGYEGSVTGLLVDHNGKTAYEWQSVVMQLKSNPSATVLITVGQDAFRAVIGNVKTSPTNKPLNTKQISFDFWQQADLRFTPVGS